MASSETSSRLHAAVLAVIVGGCGALFLATAGCSRDGSATTTQPTTDTGTGKATGKNSASASAKSADDAIIDVDPSVTELSNDKAPRPTVVGHQDDTTQWDTTKPADKKGTADPADPDFKRPRTRQRYKVFSDGSKIPDGKHEEWYPSGQKSQEGDFVDGKQQGPWKIWYENGQLCRTEVYLNGKLNGSWKTWHENGVLESEVGYKDNQRDGRWITYDPTGKQPLTQEEYKAGKRDGTWIRYFPDGKPATEEHFREGKKEGEQTAWYENGKKKLLEQYKNDLMDGKQIAWTEKGDRREFEYEAGRRKLAAEPAPAKQGTPPK